MDNNVNNTVSQNEEESSLNLRELFDMCLAKWWWFVISVVLCLGLGVLYILRTPPVYTRTAQILIKVDSNGKNGSGMSDLGGLEGFDLFQSRANINNEMATFKSPDLMAEVVRLLDLDMNYSTPGTFHREVLYGEDMPVKVTITDMPDSESPRSFEMELRPDSTVVMSKFKIEKDELDSPDLTARVNTTVNTPVGNVTIIPTSAYPEEDMEVKVSRVPVRETVEHYQKELTVTQDDEKSSVIVLSIDDVSTQRAIDILNTMIHVYNQRWVDDKNLISISTSNFIDDRLAVIEAELGNVDTDISSFKSTNLLPDVGAVSKMYMDQAKDANEQILLLSNQLYMAKYVRSYLADSDRFQLLPVNSGFESSALANQIASYNESVLQRNSLAANSSESNPIVKDMDVSINDMKRAIIISIDNQIEGLNAQIKTQQKYENQAVSKIASNPQQAKYLLSIERQQKVKESLYLYLLQKREENELSQAFTAYNTRVIVEPQGSRRPTTPVKRNVLIVSFLLGVIIPVVIIYLQGVFNTKVRGRKDLEQLTAPFIGEIPEAASEDKKLLPKLGKKKKKAEAVVAVKEGSRNVINEAFRVTRSNIEFMIGAQSKVIAVTSANPGSGKTFITFNLATSFALKDKKVLVIDLDIRKGSLSKYARSPKIGITDYIAGRVNDVHPYIVHNVQNSPLDLLPMGTMPPNPTELLYSPRFAEVIKQLRGEYDIIFLDCPPAEIVADAAIIAKEADYTLFIIRAGVFERAMLPEVEKFYHSGKYPNLSIILNGTETNSRYGSRYGYNFGYGSGTYGGYTKD